MPKTLPKSHFNNIRFNTDAIDLDARLFPTPGGPINSTPFGGGRLNLDSPKNASLISYIYSFRLSYPCKESIFMGCSSSSNPVLRYSAALTSVTILGSNDWLRATDKENASCAC